MNGILTADRDIDITRDVCPIDFREDPDRPRPPLITGSDFAGQTAGRRAKAQRAPHGPPNKATRY